MGFKEKMKDAAKKYAADKVGEKLGKLTGSEKLGKVVSKGLGSSGKSSKGKSSSKEEKIKVDKSKGSKDKKVSLMFEKKKDEFEKEKEKSRAKMQKVAQKYKKEQDLIRKKAERILDLDFVERRLAFERRHDEKKEARRDGVLIAQQDALLKEEKETFPCAVCGTEIGLGNITCPRCGSLYCMYCGSKMPDGEDFTGKCPRCLGFQNFTPAKLVQTRVEDIPAEERFWEQLSECPKCGGATQPEWDSCPICGAKLEAKVATPAPEERTIASIKEKRKQELMKRRRQQKETGPKRGI